MPLTRLALNGCQHTCLTFRYTYQSLALEKARLCYVCFFFIESGYYSVHRTIEILNKILYKFTLNFVYDDVKPALRDAQELSGTL